MQPVAISYLRGLVQLVQSVGLSITAEGVCSSADLALLWSLGFDAATGPALSEPAAEEEAIDPDEVPTEPAGHVVS